MELDKPVIGFASFLMFPCVQICLHLRAALVLWLEKIPGSKVYRFRRLSVFAIILQYSSNCNLQETLVRKIYRTIHFTSIILDIIKQEI